MIELKLNFSKCPMCSSRDITKKEVYMVCNHCGAQFVRRIDTATRESLTCILNRKTDGTMFEPQSSQVFIVVEEAEVVQFT